MNDWRDYPDRGYGSPARSATPGVLTLAEERKPAQPTTEQVLAQVQHMISKATKKTLAKAREETKAVRKQLEEVESSNTKQIIDMRSSFQEQVRTLHSRIEGLTNEVASLKASHTREGENLNSRTRELGENQVGVARALDKAAAGLSEQDTKIATLMKKVDSINSQLVDTIQRTTTTSTLVDAQGERVSTLLAETVDQQKVILQERLSEHDRKLEALESNCLSKILQTQKQVEVAGSDIRSSMRFHDSLQQQQQQMKQNNDARRTEISQVADSVASLFAISDQVQKQVKELSMTSASQKTVEKKALKTMEHNLNKEINYKQKLTQHQLVDDTARRMEAFEQRSQAQNEEAVRMRVSQVEERMLSTFDNKFNEVRSFFKTTVQSTMESAKKMGDFEELQRKIKSDLREKLTRQNQRIVAVEVEMKQTMELFSDFERKQKLVGEVAKRLVDHM
jgi:hypothetical protein